MIFIIIVIILIYITQQITGGMIADSANINPTTGEIDKFNKCIHQGPTFKATASNVTIRTYTCDDGKQQVVKYWKYMDDAAEREIELANQIQQIPDLRGVVANYDVFKIRGKDKSHIGIISDKYDGDLYQYLRSPKGKHVGYIFTDDDYMDIIKDLFAKNQKLEHFGFINTDFKFSNVFIKIDPADPIPTMVLADLGGFTTDIHWREDDGLALFQKPRVFTYVPFITPGSSLTMREYYKLILAVEFLNLIYPKMVAPEVRAINAYLSVLVNGPLLYPERTTMFPNTLEFIEQIFSSVNLITRGYIEPLPPGRPQQIRSIQMDEPSSAPVLSRSPAPSMARTPAPASYARTYSSDAF